MKVSFLQPLGTFSHEFATREFGNNIDPIPKANFREIVAAVANKEADFGVIPFLNSSGVAVEKAHKALHQHLSQVTVTKCAPLQVNHHIVVGGGFTKLERLISKEEVFPQITNWLSTWADKPEEISATSTATALKDLINSPEETRQNTAVVCNELAVDLYGGEIKYRGVQNSGNTTLFLVISPFQLQGEAERILVGLEPENIPQHQFVIDQFSEHGFPLMFSSIWGKPSSECSLFLEFQGPISPATLNELLSTTSTKVIGCYSNDHSLATCVAEIFE